MKNQALIRRDVLKLGLAASATLLPLKAFASERIAKKNGVAIKGYDTTAYFKHSKAKKGESGTVVEWKGAKWNFATVAEAKLFRANPESFAPQFGGFCTRAMSLKKIVHGDPEVWRIRGKKLYLFARPVGRDFFDKGPDAMIAKAKAHWATLS